MGWAVRVHESFEVRSPPLRKRVAYLPVVVDPFTAELRSYGPESLGKARLEAVDLVVFGFEVVSGPAGVSNGFCDTWEERAVQFEEGIGNLQHEDVRMVVLMAHQYTFTRPPHAIFFVVFL